MRIAYCGPISLSIVAPKLVDAGVLDNGYSYPFGAHFVCRLLEEGHEVVVVTSAMCVNQVFEYQDGSMSLYVCPRRHPREFILDFYAEEREALLSVIRKVSPDIVHAQWSYEFCHAARMSGVPCVVTLRDAPWQVFRHTKSIYRLYRALYAYWALRGVECITAVSPYISDYFETFYSLKNIVVVPNALKSSVLAEAGRLAPKHKEIVLLSVASWSRLKNCKTTLRAFRLIRQTFENAKLQLIGSQLEPEGPAHQWAITEGLADGVEFLGKRSHSEVIDRMCGDADLFIYPSLEESFCMVVLEAMACGLPSVVLPDAGALPWLVDYGKAGAVADSRTPRSLAVATVALLKDVERYQKISERGLARVKQSFTLEAVIQEYLKVYQEVLRHAQEH